MSRRASTLEVVSAGAKWTVRELGIGRLSTHADKVQATAEARAVAAIHTPCEVIIRNDDGTIASRETFND